MEFLSPFQLAWLGLLVPLILLYVLKRRRTEREVGSTLLWEAALRDLRAERPWKQLIPHVSLILQILAVLAGAVALARPAGLGRTPAGARIAVVVDASASMAGRDGDVRRIDTARSIARSVARGLPPGGQMMLIEAADEPTVLAAPTGEAAALERATDGLRVRGGGADIEGAIALAAERLRGASSGSRILLLSDAAMDDDIPLDGWSVPVEARRVGEAEDNTGIVAVDVRGRPTEQSPDRAEVFVRLRRFGAAGVDLYVTASVEGRGVVASRRVRLDADATASVVMTADLPPDTDGRAAVLRVELSRDGTEGTGDGLSLDDLAVAPSPGARRLPVFLIGSAPVEIRRVLRADSGVELFSTDLATLNGRDPDAPPLDGLLIYAGETPEVAPAGDSVVVAPTGDRVFEAALDEAVQRPRLLTWDEDDPRLRFMSFTDVHIGELRPVRAVVAHPLLTTDAGPAIVSIRRPDGETTLLSFDPATSDWAQQQSFVVFFRNLLERARDHRAAGGVAPGRLGASLRVSAPDGESVVVVTPSAERVTATSRGGVAVIPIAAEPGVYRLAVEGRELFALRNLLDAAESDLRSRARFTRGGRQTTAATAEGADHRESWPWLAALLLLILVLDTVWATRRQAT